MVLLVILGIAIALLALVLIGVFHMMRVLACVLMTLALLVLIGA